MVRGKNDQRVGTLQSFGRLLDDRIELHHQVERLLDVRVMIVRLDHQEESLGMRFEDGESFVDGRRKGKVLRFVFEQRNEPLGFSANSV